MASLKCKIPLLSLMALVLLLPDPINSRETQISCELKKRRTATVVKVDNDGNLRLESGEVVRLIGVMPIKLIENPRSFITKKLNQLARQTIDLLRRELEGKKISLAQAGRSRDRYDRLLAHIYDGDNKWLQGRLLRAGLARSFSYKDNRACMKEMLMLETMARKQRRGLWHYRLFAPLPALQQEKLLRKRYRFTLVEGEVRKVVSVKKWVFVNFGDNWRDDFTIAIKRKYKKTIERNGFDLHTLEGKKVRVRGWIERWNGPLIKVTHKEQIEILAEE